MTAVDLDALDKLRGFCTCAGITPPHGPLCNAPIVADLIGEARKYRALREAVEGLAEELTRDQREGWVPVGRGASVGRARDLAFANRLRTVVATVDSP